MKKATVGALVVALAVGSAAMAADRYADDSHHDGYDHQDHHDDHGDHHDDHGDHHDDHGRYGDYHRPKGYHDHRWARGERLPRAYYASPYVVRNYRERGWHAPPRGYQWVRVDHDVVLAAIATGAVLEVLGNQF